MFLHLLDCLVFWLKEGSKWRRTTVKNFNKLGCPELGCRLGCARDILDWMLRVNVLLSEVNCFFTFTILSFVIFIYFIHPNSSILLQRYAVASEICENKRAATACRKWKVTFTPINSTSPFRMLIPA